MCVCYRLRFYQVQGRQGWLFASSPHVNEEYGIRTLLPIDRGILPKNQQIALWWVACVVKIFHKYETRPIVRTSLIIVYSLFYL